MPPIPPATRGLVRAYFILSGSEPDTCIPRPVGSASRRAVTRAYPEGRRTRAGRGIKRIPVGQVTKRIPNRVGNPKTRMSWACCKVLPRAVTSRIPPRIESVIKTRMSGAPAVKSPSPGPAGKRRCCTARLATSRLTQNLQATRIEVGNRGADVWARYI